MMRNTLPPLASNDLFAGASPRNGRRASDFLTGIKTRLMCPRRTTIRKTTREIWKQRDSDSRTVGARSASAEGTYVVGTPPAFCVLWRIGDDINAHVFAAVRVRRWCNIHLNAIDETTQR